MSTKLLVIAASTIMAIGIAGCAGWNSAKTTSASTSSEHRGPVQTADDAAITAKVKAKFAADDVVKAHKIDVDTTRGVVMLNGTVSSAAERDRAISLARDTSGVVDVRSNLRFAG